MACAELGLGTAADATRVPLARLTISTRCITPAHPPSVIHPRCHPASAEPGCEAQTGRAHRKVANEIPNEADDLDDCREERQDGALKLE